ncbi:hypothetical protein like AT1G11125 [Hibiscus trionum]|uniref:Uncharacterized protein n=1 Tax=Hibiscus trionum TaxID=183268 RepID=A0A9W7H8B8_HIBTR|nr:hypothetical protein like AT1G11125 [Hibiscus trionum]
MGCCVSTNRGSPPAKESHAQASLENKASAEEETVKEVLSETPKPKAPEAHISVPQQEDSEKSKTQIEKPAFGKIQPKESLDFNVKSEPKSPVTEEYSASEEVSEICSVSLSESLSTVTRDEDDEVRQQKVLRSPARSGSRNRVVGMSPNRRNGGSSGRLVQSREPQVRRGSRPEPPRKNPGESTGRRSRSAAVMGRSLSGRRVANHSPGRVGRDPGEQQQQQQQHGTMTSSMEGSNNNNGATTSAPKETIENPLVSLECFIFL